MDLSAFSKLFSRSAPPLHVLIELRHPDRIPWYFTNDNRDITWRGNTYSATAMKWAFPESSGGVPQGGTLEITVNESAASADVPSPLVLGAHAYWPFDDGTGVDASGNDRHATIPASGVIPAQGRLGGGMGFLGGRVVTPITGDFFLRDFTVSIWINPGDRETRNRFMGTNAGVGNPEAFFAEITTGGTLAFIFANHLFTGTNISIPLNRWAHVILKRRGNRSFWKVNDGTEGSSDRVPGGGGGSPFAIGSDRNGGSELFRGLIDEVAVFDRATTDFEDSALFALTRPGPRTELLRWFDMADDRAEIVVRAVINDGEITELERMTQRHGTASWNGRRITWSPAPDDRFGMHLNPWALDSEALLA